jgi:predicted Zn-dependent peptidase
VNSVEKISIRDLSEFKEKHYTPSNMFAVVTGKISHEEVIDFLDSIFSNLKSNKKVVDKRNFKFIKDKLNLEIISKERSGEQAHLAWGLFGCEESNEDAPVLDVIATILGRGLTSRLYRLIREERGLAYHVSLGFMGLKDNGIITGYAGLDFEKLEEVKKIIIDEFKRISEEEVLDEELNRAKMYIKGAQTSRLDNLPSYNGYIGSSIILGTSANPEDYINKIESVEKDEILRISKKYFQEENIMFSQIIPKK